jgi:hypothetical protein
VRQNPVQAVNILGRNFSFLRLNDPFLNTVAFIFVFRLFSFDWIPDTLADRSPRE